MRAGEGLEAGSERKREIKFAGGGIGSGTREIEESAIALSERLKAAARSKVELQANGRKPGAVARFTVLAIFPRAVTHWLPDERQRDHVKGVFQRRQPCGREQARIAQPHGTQGALFRGSDECR